MKPILIIACLMALFTFSCQPPGTSDPGPGNAIVPSGTVTTVAGPQNISGSADGTGTSARFCRPAAITSDGTYLYICDTCNYTIRKADIATGAVTTIAGLAGAKGATDGIGAAARFYNPNGIATDGDNLYISDSGNHTIRRLVLATGEVTTLAGAAGLYGGTDGIGAAARFYVPLGIVFVNDSLYVCEQSNQTIRRIVVATGAVTTLAGLSGVAGSLDGTGASALFFYPVSMASDGTNLYVCDYGNNTVRQVVIASGAVTTLAGQAPYLGSTDGVGSAARFTMPNGIARKDGYLYISDGNNNTIRRMTITDKTVTTVAGKAGLAGCINGVGPSARFYCPDDLVCVGGDLFICDYYNQSIRRLNLTTGAVSLFAGLEEPCGGRDGIGSAARFTLPTGMTSVGTSVFISDSGNHTIRRLDTVTGEVTTFAGAAGEHGATDGTGGVARFFTPMGLATDGANIFVCDRDNHTIRQIAIASGEVTTLVGTASAFGSDAGVGPAARFNQPTFLVCLAGKLYVTDSANHTVRVVEIATRTANTIQAGYPGQSGSTNGAPRDTRFNYPRGIATDGVNLYVCDSSNQTIRKVPLAPGLTTTLAGSVGIAGITDGSGAAARFYYPLTIACDGKWLYVCDNGNQTIRKVSTANGAVTTFAGSVRNRGAADGLGTAALFSSPYGIVSTGTDLYVSDSENFKIRKITK